MSNSNQISNLKKDTSSKPWVNCWITGKSEPRLTDCSYRLEKTPKDNEQGNSDQFKVRKSLYSKAVAIALILFRAHEKKGAFYLALARKEAAANIIKRIFEETREAKARSKLGTLRSMEFRKLFILHKNSTEFTLKVGQRLKSDAVKIYWNETLIKDPQRLTHLAVLIAKTEGWTLPDSLIKPQPTGKAHQKPLNKTLQNWRIGIVRVDFLGRDDLLERIAGEFQSKKRRIYVMHGTPGVGKTQFALALANRLRKIFHSGVQIDMQGFCDDKPPLSVAEAMRTIIRKLSLSSGSCELPDSPVEVEKQYQELFQNANEPVLLIFDNANNESQVKPLLPQQPCGGGVIITSKYCFNVDGEEAQKLPPLTPDEAVQFLHEHAPKLKNRRVQAPPENSHQMTEVREAAAVAAEILGYLPQALASFAGIVKIRLKFQSAAELIEDLRTGRLKMKEVEDSLESSYKTIGTLPKVGKKLQYQFSQMAVFTGDFNCKIAGAIWGNPSDLNEILTELISANLVEDGSDEGRLRLPDVIRKFAGRKLDENGARELTNIRFAAYFSEFLKSLNEQYLKGNEEQKAALSAFEEDRSNIEMALRWAQENASKLDVAARICSTIWADCKLLLQHCLSHRVRLKLALASLAAAQKLGDVPAQVQALHQRGICLALEGLPEEAKVQYIEALNLLDSACAGTTEAPILRASVMASLAWYFSDLGDYASAIRNFRHCIRALRKGGEIYDELYAVDGLGEAIMLKNHPRLARRFFKYIRNRLTKEYGNDRVQTIYDCLALRCLGWSYALDGDPDKGIKPCFEAVKVARTIGHQRIEAIARWQLGFCYSRSGNQPEAIVEYQAALQLAKRWSLGGKVEILKELWHIAVETGQIDLANQIAKEFLESAPDSRYVETTSKIKLWLEQRQSESTSIQDFHNRQDESCPPIFVLKAEHFDEAIRQAFKISPSETVHYEWVDTDGDSSTHGLQRRLERIISTTTARATKVLYYEDFGWKTARNQACIERLDVILGELRKFGVLPPENTYLGFIGTSDGTTKAIPPRHYGLVFWHRPE